MRACNPQTNQPYASHREAKNLYECECECESAHLPAHRQSFPIPRPESKKRPQSNPIQSNPIQSKKMQNFCCRKQKYLPIPSLPTNHSNSLACWLFCFLFSGFFIPPDEVKVDVTASLSIMASRMKRPIEKMGYP